MITVKVNNEEYIINWYYNQEPNYNFPETKIRKMGNVKQYKENQITTCTISTVNDPFTVYKGISICQPTDQFQKSVGRKISLTRALANSNFTKEERKVFWDTYNNRNQVDKNITDLETLINKVYLYLSEDHPIFKTPLFKKYPKPSFEFKVPSQNISI